MPETLPNRIPVSIITGFLGAGKTTLISHLLTQPGMEKTALIINEFGEIGLDNLLVETAIENTLVLENGCICCSIRGDLIDTISDLFAKSENEQIPNFSRILIETTGLADPGPIVESINTEIAVQNRCQLERVVTLVDGVQGRAQIQQHEEAVVQIAQADIALISKTDICNPAEVENLKSEISAINPTLVINPIEQGRVDPDYLFKDSSDHVVSAVLTHDHHSHHNHHHNHGDVATWSLEHEEPIDEERLRAWLSMITTLRPYALLRLKGLIRLTTSERPLLLQAVGTQFSPPEWLEKWPGDLPRTQLVLIFKELSPDILKKSFHRHVLGQNSN
jgi:G3E family GTPase